MTTTKDNWISKLRRDPRRGLNRPYVSTILLWTVLIGALLFLLDSC